MKYTLPLVVGTFFALNYTEAAAPSPRYNGGCQLLSGHIYCFGGASSTGAPVTYYNDLYVLDLSQNIPNIATPNWVQLASGFEPNSNFVMAPSSDTSFFIVGGTGSSDGHPLIHAFSSYNINSNTWTSYSNSNASSTWVQTLGSSGTPNNGYTLRPDPALYLFGGRTDSTIGANTTYPSSILALNMISGTWSASLAAANPMAARVGHRVVYLNTHMVVVGGQIATSNGQGGYVLSDADMSVLPYYDSVFLSWHNGTITGTVPSPRSYFTLTPLSKYSASAILYGGVDANNQPCMDTMYRLSFSGVVANTWTTLSGKSSATASGPGPLYGHSAIAYSAYTMLVLNGIDQTGESTNSVHVYDVMGDQWTGYFSTNGRNPSSPPSSGSTSSPSYTSFETSQGVASGVGVGGLIFFGIIGLLLCRHVEKHQRLAWKSEQCMAAPGTKQEIVEEPLLELRPNLHHGHYTDHHDNLNATNVSSDHYREM